jgi:hypothetical protein
MNFSTPDHLVAPDPPDDSEIRTTSKKTVSARWKDSCLRRLCLKAEGPSEAAESSNVKSVTAVRHSEPPAFWGRLTIQLRVTSIMIPS